MVHFALYGFNTVAFFSCLIIVAGQVAVMSQINFKSPELVVLGITIIGLWVLSGLGNFTSNQEIYDRTFLSEIDCGVITGIYGVRTEHRQILRMYAFMLLVLILLQVSIVTTLYQNLDSSFLDEFVKLIRSLCVSPFDDSENSFGTPQ